MDRNRVRVYNCVMVVKKVGFISVLGAVLIIQPAISIGLVPVFR